jgi:hypothetical protein
VKLVVQHKQQRSVGINLDCFALTVDQEDLFHRAPALHLAHLLDSRIRLEAVLPMKERTSRMASSECNSTHRPPRLISLMLRYRFHPEERGLAPGTINVRMAAVRRLAFEAAGPPLLTLLYSP